MLPTNVLQRLHAHVELALKEGTRRRGESAPLGQTDSERREKGRGGGLRTSPAPSIQGHPRTHHLPTGDVEGARFCLFVH